MDAQILVPVGSLIAIGSLVLTLQKIAKNFKKDREEHAAKILQQAKEEDALIKAKLEARVDKLSHELKTLQASVGKDIEHIKETYNGEIRNLGEKIEELRSELRNQHGQLVNLLSEMIRNSKD